MVKNKYEIIGHVMFAMFIQIFIMKYVSVEN